MRFGSKVWVCRGGSRKPGTPGCARQVEGVLVGATGNVRLVRLAEDDPQDTVGWKKTGDVGYWDASAVRERE